MNDKSILYGAGGLIVGLVAGSMFAPQLMGDGMMRGGMSGGGASHVDSRFIEMMIPHHEGAIAMAERALERSKRPEIQSLAQGVIDAQTHENEQMRQWYEEWYGGAPAEAGMQMMGHGMHMEGMEGDLEKLTTAPNFDIEFIDQMVVHHEMAIMMAQMLASGTERTEMKQLADQIITSQSREIDMMRSWREAWTAAN